MLLLKNGIYNLISTAIRAGLSLISIPILVKIMGSEDYGVWTLISSILSILIIVEGGLPISATVFVAKDLANQDRQGLSKSISSVILFMLVISTTILIVTLLSAESISHFFTTLSVNQKTQLSTALRIGIFGIWFQLMQQVLIGIDHAFKNFRTPSILNSLQWIFMVSGWIIIAAQGGDAIRLVQWQTLVLFFCFAAHGFLFIDIIKKYNIIFVIEKQKSIEIIKYGAASWLAVIGRALYVRGDRIVVGSLLSPSQLGIYHVIQELSSAIVVFSSIIVQPLAPTVADLITKLPEYADKLGSQVKQSIKYNIIFSVVMGSVLYVLSSYIVQFTIDCPKESPLFLYYVNCFKISIVINTFVAANGVGYWILFGIRKVLVSATILIGFGMMSLLTIYLGGISAGLIGATLGNLTYIGTVVMSMYAVKKMPPDQIKMSFVLKISSLYLFFLLCIVGTQLFLHP